MSTVAHDTNDETVARYAPSPASVAAEWTLDRRNSLLATIVGRQGSSTGDLDVVHELMTDAPASRIRRRAALLPLAASIAVFAAGAGTLIAVMPGGTGSDSGAVGSLPPGEPFDPPAGLSAKALAAGEWASSVYRQNDIDERGRVIPNGHETMTLRTWTSARGDVYDVRSGQQNGCSFSRAHSNGTLDYPSAAFFRTLPTDPETLLAYLRRQANGGSSSRDEAVFVAVGDTLRFADGLASPQLRGAFVAALSRTAGVLLHHDVHDQLGRLALRADFVDQQIRPGEVHSLFFSPTDFRLLEERLGSNGAPSRYAGPSPAYTHAATRGRDSTTLTGKAYAETHSGDRVVKHLPASLRSCKKAVAADLPRP